VLPVVPPEAEPQTAELLIDGASRDALRAAAPPAAWPALEQLFNAPESVGLAAFQVGREAEGAYLNAETPMPLASVVKLVTLVAYAEAAAAGELNPAELVPLSELERFYLPRFDLGAHRRAVEELRREGRVFGETDPAVSLDDVGWMMIRHSSNAASDYLHWRLGQARIEQTAIALGLATQSAPCPFLGQFLMMANHTRPAANDVAAVHAYAADPVAYAGEMGLLADAFSNDPEFRQAEIRWREDTRRPSLEGQRAFSDRLNPQGSAGDYATLMAGLAQNSLGPEASYQARRLLEWPNQFAANQALFSNVGYKNGSLPGVLTTAYYAYRWDAPAAPVVVTLFYRDLPQQTYRAWRSSLAHDELARWLLADPAAMGLLRAALGG
jgi:D-alanyl-D-alanine carboxypeptidase